MKHTKLSDDLIILTTKLMMAENKCEILNIANNYTSIIQKLIDAEKKLSPTDNILKKNQLRLLWNSLYRRFQ